MNNEQLISEAVKRLGDLSFACKLARAIGTKQGEISMSPEFVEKHPLEAQHQGMAIFLAASYANHHPGSLCEVIALALEDCNCHKECAYVREVFGTNQMPDVR